MGTHGEKEGKPFIYNYIKKLNSFMKKKNYPYLILIINRNFFERDISDYFFKINRHLKYNNKILFNDDNCNLEDLIIKYNENSIQNKQSIFLYYHWYDYVFSKCFNLNLYDYEFKNNKIFIEQDLCDILVIRKEDIIHYNQIFKEILNINFEFENNSNSLCKKDLSHKNSIGIYNKFYKQFYKNYVLPKKQYNFLFNNKITKFFYTDDEIKKIIDFPTIFS